jgi:hypothetical protein
VPLSATLCVPALPALMSIVVLSAPSTVGLNTALMVHAAPAASELPQLLVCENWAGFEPEIVMLVIDNTSLPVLVTVIGAGALATPLV